MPNPWKLPISLQLLVLYFFTEVGKYFRRRQPPFVFLPSVYSNISCSPRQKKGVAVVLQRLSVQRLLARIFWGKALPFPVVYQLLSEIRLVFIFFFVVLHRNPFSLPFPPRSNWPFVYNYRTVTELLTILRLSMSWLCSSSNCLFSLRKSLESLLVSVCEACVMDEWRTRANLSSYDRRLEYNSEVVLMPIRAVTI